MNRLLWILIILTVLQIGLHVTEILIDLSQSNSDTLWEYLGLSDTFRKGTEKGEVVVFKSRSDSHSQTNRSELTQRNAQKSHRI